MAQAMLSKMKAHKLASSVFIGATGILSKGDFKSLDGTDLANTALGWAAGEPNNANNAEDCLAMNEVGALEDVSCSRLLPYFCRKESTNKCRVTHVKSLCNNYGYKWESHTGSCYKFHGAAKTWRLALATCHSEGGHLAIINNEIESKLLKKIYKENVKNIEGAKESRHALIGFRRWDDGEWATIHGESLINAGFSQWSPSEPNNSGGEKCGSIHDNGLLNDAPCDEPFAFICEISP
ncbi:hemolymph lipopolysaccharide-binding protein-like [Cydia fagiglandana]|uniref:hemolymph lipopolysaccharide-binding protein-like n=1 Tax=Cydia fagiglandana TaxID=1458189 RepID=UPI002FEDEBB2